MTLEGKHALVTGGGTGIGLAIAQALAAEGAQVTITGRRHEVLEEVATQGLHPMAMDVRIEEDVAAKVDAAVAARGPVQICVANAGVAEGAALHKTSMEFWRNMMATNLDGAFLTIRECFKSMRQTDWGRVITVSSIAGLRGLKGAACYSASKHGMIGLTRALSEDYLGTPFTFNALPPGYAAPPFAGRNVPATPRPAASGGGGGRGGRVTPNRHKRLIEPSEVAAAALWLCGPGSGSVNGQCIEIAGGQT